MRKKFATEKMLKLKRALVTSLSAGTVFVLGAVPAFAAESDIANVMGTAFTGLKADFLAAIAIALPVGLAIFGTIFTIRKVKAGFNTIAK